MLDLGTSMAGRGAAWGVACLIVIAVVLVAWFVRREVVVLPRRNRRLIAARNQEEIWVEAHARDHDRQGWAS